MLQIQSLQSRTNIGIIHFISKDTLKGFLLPHLFSNCFPAIFTGSHKSSSSELPSCLDVPIPQAYTSPINKNKQCFKKKKKRKKK